jgi:hypothetical protein
MHIVTLTTDFGLQDYYVPVLKGAMLSRHAELNFVDVSHNIKNHDIVQAAFVLKNTWRSFPEGTIHVASVNNFGGERHRFLVILHQNHYFVGPDNGIFSLIFEDTPQYVYEIPFAGLNFAPVRDCLADAVGYIASAKPIADIGLVVTDMVQRITLQPVISHKIYFTKSGMADPSNCISNATILSPRFRHIIMMWRLAKRSVFSILIILKLQLIWVRRRRCWGLKWRIRFRLIF